jgi:hypothetical protein
VDPEPGSGGSRQQPGSPWCPQHPLFTTDRARFFTVNAIRCGYGRSDRDQFVKNAPT